MAERLRLFTAILALAVVTGAGAVVAGAAAVPAAAQSPSAPPPGPPPGLTMTVEPLLGGSFRPGTWMAVGVEIENHGPAIAGELRLVNSLGASATQSVAVDLPTGARQEHVIYGQIAPVAARYRVELAVDDAVLHSVNMALETDSTDGLRAYVVAERPEHLVGSLGDALEQLTRERPIVVSMGGAALPPLAQAWASMDVLVWQDGDPASLDGDRVEALRTWLAGGGSLVIVAGSGGLTTLGAFPEDLLPFRPETTLDLAAADLALFAEPPAEAAPVAALSGSLARGSAIVTSAGGAVIAGRAPVGRGSVTLLGIDPGTAWMAESPFGTAVWSRVLPAGLTPGGAPDPRPDMEFEGAEFFMVEALSNIPAVRLPDLAHLLALLAAYVVAIGPINYFLLRRRRRELAWLTMPVTIVVFALGAYLLGTTTRGPNAVINELAIVRGATGAERGIGQVYVGVFSPGRASYDVTIGGRALISLPDTRNFGFEQDPRQQTLNVRQGDPSTIRDFGVSFGSVRAFTATAQLSTPRIDTDLRIVGEGLEGTVTNSSAMPLANVSVVYGGSFAHLGDVAPGETRTLAGMRQVGRFNRIAESLVPWTETDDAQTLWMLSARRSIVDHLDGGWATGQGLFIERLNAGGPTVIAFASGAPLDVSLGGSAEQIGQSVFLLQARAEVSGPVSFGGSSLSRTVVGFDAAEMFVEEGRFHLSRGTMTVDYRTADLEGRFRPSALVVRFGGTVPADPGSTDVLAPLPADQQPDPDAPLAITPAEDELDATYPRLQLFDVAAQTWVEFAPVESGQPYTIDEPERWLDRSGALRARFVVRGTGPVAFAFDARIQGTVE